LEKSDPEKLILQAILGEIPKNYCCVIVNGTTAYVLQSAWIKNETVKANIIFWKNSTKNTKIHL